MTLPPQGRGSPQQRAQPWSKTNIIIIEHWELRYMYFVLSVCVRGRWVDMFSWLCWMRAEQEENNTVHTFFDVDIIISWYGESVVFKGCITVKRRHFWEFTKIVLVLTICYPYNIVTIPISRYLVKYTMISGLVTHSQHLWSAFQAI